MPLLEALGLAGLTLGKLWELCKDNPALGGVAGNRADAGFVAGWDFGKQAFRRVRACFGKLAKPENDILRRAAAVAHWQSVCHAAVFYGRARGFEVESGLDPLPVPDALKQRFLREAPGVLAKGEQEALRRVYVLGLDRVKDLQKDVPLTAPSGGEDAVLDRLEILFTERRDGVHPLVEAAWSTLNQELSDGFRDFFAHHWFDFLAINFQVLVQSRQDVANQLQTQWLAELKIQFADGRIFTREDWGTAFEQIRELVQDSERRIREDIKTLGDRLEGPVAPPGARPDTTPSAATDYFCGRGEVLAEIRRRLEEGGKAALWAEGGAGKTQTALRYVDLHRSGYPAILRADAGTATGFLSGYQAFAEAARIGVPNDFQRTLSNVRAWLEANPGCLIVLDNAVDETAAEIRQWLPRTGNGHLLATTRHPDLSAYGRYAMLEVRPFTSQESAAFLRGRLPGEMPWTESDEATAQALGERLGGLPLAMEQAGAYIQVNACALSEYLRRFNLALLHSQKPVQGNYPESVETTWRINFEAIESQYPAAASVLRASAFLAPAPIPIEFVTEFRTNLEGGACSAAEARELLAPLARYSLIRRNRGGGWYSLHRLVAEVMRNRLGNAAEDWQRRAVLALAQAWPDTGYSSWALCRLLLPHSRHLWGTVSSDAWEKWLDSLRLLNQAGLFLTRQGRYGEAEPLYVRALEASERVLGAEHPDTLTYVNNLAGLYESQGRYGEAERLFLRALGVRERVLGEEHPDTLASANNLANLYASQGRYGEAKPRLVRALEARERVLGAEHTDTLASVNNLALLYARQRRYEEAKPLFVRALEASERALGAEHPNTLTSVNNLAHLYQSQACYREAEPLFAWALAARERVLGGEHPDTITSVNNLAGLHARQGRYEEAKPLYVRALAARERVLGAEHPDTLGSVNNLAHLYAIQGRYGEAEPLFVRALEGLERRLGPDHPDTKTVRSNLERLRGR